LQKQSFFDLAGTAPTISPKKGREKKRRDRPHVIEPILNKKRDKKIVGSGLKAAFASM